MADLKSTIMPPLVLAGICGICCGLLAVANSVTKDKIAAAEAESVAESLSQLPEAGTFTEITDFTAKSNEKATPTALYEDENGQYGVLITADGYNKGGLQVIVGVKDGAVTGITFVSCSETPGLGTKVRDNPDQFTDNLKGLTSSEEVEAVDGITGATYSSKGMRAAVCCALETVQANGEVQS